MKYNNKYICFQSNNNILFFNLLAASAFPYLSVKWSLPPIADDEIIDGSFETLLRIGHSVHLQLVIYLF